MILGLLASIAARAEPPPAEAYGEAVRLVEMLFLEPDAIDPARMLREAARELERDIPWLLEEVEGDEVVIRHGDGAELGRVSAASLAELPKALARLEAIVTKSGYDVGGVDVRLSVLGGMADALDRYSRVLADERLDRFNVRLTGTLVGIGATFAIDGQERMVVVQVTDGSPAAEGGLLVGDRILRIDGRSTVGMPLSEATRRIRGEAGTQVALRIERGGVEQSVALTRAEVVVPNVVSRVLDGGVGYVAIDHVSQRTVENLAGELAKLRAAGALSKGLVIDLRGNTGGSMKESANVADLFLEDGLLLRTVGKDGGAVQNLQAEMRASDDGTEPEIPLVLLVDERTASGSEILAGALLELERAALVGTRTYGKGTVQKIYPLADEVRFKLTVARYILANDRRIADTGIVPDVSIGRITLDHGNVRYTGWDEAFQRVPWAEIVPEVATGEGDLDLALEIARRALLASAGTSRGEVVARARHEAAVARAEQEKRLADALTARGIDWSPAPEDGTFVDAHVAVRAEPLDGDAVRLVATVENRGAEPLHRALVQLDCFSASWWDDVVVPVGFVPAGATATGAVTVPLEPGIDGRVDAVEVRLRADRRPPLLVGEQTLESGSSPPPVLRVQARLVPVEGATGAHEGPIARAEITVQNLSRTPLTGLEVHLGYPGSDAIELVDWAARVPQVPGRSERRVDLTMEVGPAAPDTLPLELVIQADRYGELVDWPLPLPKSGAAVLLQAPQIEARVVRRAPIGPFTLPVSVVDDRAIEHVVISVNGDKVSWAPGAGARVDLAPTFELLPGANRIVVHTRDDQGLAAVRAVTVRGEPHPVAVDAEGD